MRNNKNLNKFQEADKQIKKTIIYISIAILLLSGCSKNTKTASVMESTEKTSSEQSVTSGIENDPPVEPSENNSFNEDSSEKNIASVSTETQTTVSVTESSEATDTASQITDQSEQPKPTKPDEKESEPSYIEPTEPEQMATAEDTAIIAERMIYYINKYRNEQNVESAIKLPGLTKYAEYRSRQLVSNFEHDTLDERKAATELKYGKYVDPVLYGSTGTPYFTSCSREAIAMRGCVDTVENVAKAIATQIKKSQPHWCYVGASEYKYIAVGVTYAGGRWYADVAMSETNKYEK